VQEPPRLSFVWCRDHIEAAHDLAVRRVVERSGDADTLPDRLHIANVLRQGDDAARGSILSVTADEDELPRRTVDPRGTSGRRASVFEGQKLYRSVADQVRFGA
jgi:hypothetical protein